ncbi:hypothetical protein QBC45DRAFT_436169 [Copromyces sp. CBS 386.78]|nr:hypothetical protein QBC45DRAFT_436169 [Copromyces sp. CBS 386.78]
MARLLRQLLEVALCSPLAALDSKGSGSIPSIHPSLNLISFIPSRVWPVSVRIPDAMSLTPQPTARCMLEAHVSIWVEGASWVGISVEEEVVVDEEECYNNVKHHRRSDNNYLQYPPYISSLRKGFAGLQIMHLITKAVRAGQAAGKISGWVPGFAFVRSNAGARDMPSDIFKLGPDPRVRRKGGDLVDAGKTGENQGLGLLNDGLEAFLPTYRYLTPE